MSGEGKVVCVTGASGFLASCLVKLLLERGYTVKATVRNLSDPMKVVHLKAFDGAKDRLVLFEADLLEDGSFDSAINGCDGVFHTASPVVFDPADPQAEVIEPALRGTLNVLKSCSEASSVRRVVLTSSITAVLCNRNTRGPGVVVDETWFSNKVYCEESKLWYPLSKIMAEEAAWKFAEEIGIDLVVMNPGLVVGPLLQPTLNSTAEFFMDIIKEMLLMHIYWVLRIHQLRGDIVWLEQHSVDLKFYMSCISFILLSMFPLLPQSIQPTRYPKRKQKVWASISCLWRQA
ncbi:hypothetical protein ACS0TY_007109 [Phlomoides rotata]